MEGEMRWEITHLPVRVVPAAERVRRLGAGDLLDCCAVVRRPHEES